MTLYYQLNERWNMDLEYAWTKAELRGNSADGNEIPGAVKNVVQAGISSQRGEGWFGSLRLRYFGERPLVEDGSVTSDPTTVVNLRSGYSLNSWVFSADVLNLFDSRDHDIDYWYASRLAGESSEQEDIHYHVIEPRTVRLAAAYQF